MAPFRKIGQSFKHKVGVDRIDAIPHETGKMLHFAGFTGFKGKSG